MTDHWELNHPVERTEADRRRDSKKRSVAAVMAVMIIMGLLGSIIMGVLI